MLSGGFSGFRYVPLTLLFSRSVEGGFLPSLLLSERSSQRRPVAHRRSLEGAFIPAGIRDIEALEAF